MKIENQRGPIVGSYSRPDRKQATCEADAPQNLASFHLEAPQNFPLFNKEAATLQKIHHLHWRRSRITGALCFHPGFAGRQDIHCFHNTSWHDKLPIYGWCDGCLCQRFAFHHEDEEPNLESIPFGYYNPKGCVHPRAAFQQRSDVAGQEEYSPCPWILVFPRGTHRASGLRRCQPRQLC